MTPDAPTSPGRPTGRNATSSDAGGSASRTGPDGGSRGAAGSPAPDLRTRWRRALAAAQRALAAEAVKLTSTRSLRWTFAAFAVLTPVMAVFVAVTGSLQPDDTVMGGSLTAAPLAQVVAAAFGAVVMTGEYSTGTVRATFAATPGRGTVLAAKAALVAAAVFVAGLLSSAVAVAIGATLLAGDGYATGEPLPALVGVAASFASLAVLGLAVGALLRHSAGAVAAVVGVVLLPPLVAPMFGDAQRWVAGASPTSALEKMTQTSDAAPDVVGSLGAWPSLALVVAYAALATAASAAVLRRRDV
jgi:ABC-2 type transport system permease protein